MSKNMMNAQTVRSPLKYVQLKEKLLLYFQTEGYVADQKLPTENDLINRFQVSRITVRKALDELVHDGVIYKIQGSGSFFSGKIPERAAASYLIGVIAPHVFSHIYPQIIHPIDEVAHERGYNLVLGGSKSSPDRELTCLRQLLEKKIDGLIFEPSSGFQYEADTETTRLLKTLTIPLVFMDWAIEDPNISYVAPDDVEGGFRAVSYLIKAGHRRIACIYPPNHFAGLKRYEGYRKALEMHGIPYDPRLDKGDVAMLREAHSRGVMTALLKELLESGEERPTAIFYFNDILAAEGVAAIQEAGLTVPDDISIIGYDDSDDATQANVALTTVAHPKEFIGQWAADILFDEIEHAGRIPHRHVLATPTLVLRDSVKRL